MLVCAHAVRAEPGKPDATKTEAGTSASPEAQKRDQVFVWFTKHVCKDEGKAGEPGSTPELAIDEADFWEPFQSASTAKEEDGVASRYECKWVRLTGFFAWLNYYHYRGRFYASAWDKYRGDKTSYIIERFADPATRRSQLAQRRVTLVGRFYDLCAAAERARQADDSDWVMVFGPCHYGSDRGMMLTDVRITTVHDDDPQYLLGDGNRKILNDLFPVKGEARAGLIEGVRAWAAAVKRGPAAFASDVIANDKAWYEKYPDEEKQLRASVESGDSYFSYLGALPRFQTLDVSKAPVEVWWDSDPGETTPDRAVGCICLAKSCKDKWPISTYDADQFLGEAACASLSRKDVKAKWTGY